MTFPMCLLEHGEGLVGGPYHLMKDREINRTRLCRRRYAVGQTCGDSVLRKPRGALDERSEGLHVDSLELGMALERIGGVPRSILE